MNTDANLPEAAARRLRAIRNRAAASFAVRLMLGDRRNAALARRREAQDVLNGPLWRVTDRRADDAARTAAVAKFDTAVNEIAEIDARLAVLPKTGLPGRIDNFLRRLPFGPIAEGPAVKLSPKKG